MAPAQRGAVDGAARVHPQRRSQARRAKSVAAPRRPWLYQHRLADRALHGLEKLICNGGAGSIVVVVVIAVAALLAAIRPACYGLVGQCTHEDVFRDEEALGSSVIM